MDEINTTTNPIIFQAPNGALEFVTNREVTEIWANQSNLAQLYGKDQSVISRHIRNIFKEEEIDKNSNMQKMHIANSDKPVEFYSIDIILAVGYRVNSVRAIQFRKWATQTLKQHITKGFTINDTRIQQNKALFLKTIEDLKILTENTALIDSKDLLTLIESFSNTWFSLDKFDKGNFPTIGTKKELIVNATELLQEK